MDRTIKEIYRKTCEYEYLGLALNIKAIGRETISKKKAFCIYIGGMYYGTLNNRKKDEQKNKKNIFTSIKT